MAKPDTHLYCLSDENESFLNDCVALFSGKKAANLHPYLYGSPENSEDPVRGSALYERLLTEEKNYYLYEFEADLIREQVQQIALCVGDNATVIEFGAGGEQSVHQKTLPFLHSLTNLNGYVSVDISQRLLANCLETVHLALPKLSIRGICCDFTKLDTDLFKTFEKPVVFFPGSTIANLAPQETYVFMAKIKNIVSEKGLFIVGQDSNQDHESLMKAYHNPYNADLVTNVLWRIKRDLHVDKLQPDDFVYMPEWNATKFDFKHLLIAKKNQLFHISDKTIHIETGQSVHVASSYKYPVQVFENMGISAGFESDIIFRDNYKRMALHIFRAI